MEKLKFLSDISCSDFHLSGSLKKFLLLKQTFVTSREFVFYFYVERFAIKFVCFIGKRSQHRRGKWGGRGGQLHSNFDEDLFFFLFREHRFLSENHTLFLLKTFFLWRTIVVFAESNPISTDTCNSRWNQTLVA